MAQGGGLPQAQHVGIMGAVDLRQRRDALHPGVQVVVVIGLRHAVELPLHRTSRAQWKVGWNLRPEA